MSQAPLVLRNSRWGIKLGAKTELEDSLWLGLQDSYCKLPMGITAENLAEKYHITREDADKFALRSQHLWGKGLCVCLWLCVCLFVSLCLFLSPLSFPARLTHVLSWLVAHAAGRFKNEIAPITVKVGCSSSCVYVPCPLLTRGLFSLHTRGLFDL